MRLPPRVALLALAVVTGCTEPVAGPQGGQLAPGGPARNSGVVIKTCRISIVSVCDSDFPFSLDADADNSDVSPLGKFTWWRTNPGGPVFSQRPVTLTFTKPAVRVDYVAAYPYGGIGSVIAYGPQGGVIYQKILLGVDGNSWHRYEEAITGSISQVVFSPPPPNSGVQILTWAADVTYEVPAAPVQLDLVCDALSITRGQSISCTAIRSGGQDIQSWEFIPSDPILGSTPIPRAPANATSPWQGIMVSSGQVTVRDVNQNVATATIQVNNRSWGINELPYNPATDKTDGVPRESMFCGPMVAWDDPPLTGETGQTCHDVPLPFALTPSEWFTIVPSGPNTGLSYALTVPGRLKIQTSVNTEALRQDSRFYQLQPVDATGGFCGQAWVANRAPMSGMHEGVGPSPHPQSHAGNLPGFWALEYVRPIEKLVRRGYPTSADIRGLAKRAKPIAELFSNTETHDDLQVWKVNCNLIRSK
jgi:hypothetical protein